MLLKSMHPDLDRAYEHAQLHDYGYHIAQQKLCA